MESIGICDKGLEDVGRAEVDEILGKKAKKEDTVVSFDASKEELCKLCYRTQSFSKVMAVLCKTEVNNHLEESLVRIKEAIDQAEFSRWLTGKSFRVNCRRIGGQDYSSQDIAPKVGEYIIDKTGAQVSLDSPDVIVYTYIYYDRCYIGIDFAGFDLSKRDYKVFTQSSSLASTVAHGLVRLSGFDDGVLLDPFCGASTIPIEAALYMEKKSPLFYKKDKLLCSRMLDLDFSEFDGQEKGKGEIYAFDHVLRNLRSTRSNAKLAGVKINASKVDIEWLDTKFEEETIDAIVTQPPSPSTIWSEKEAAKLYKEFFHQASFVLKKKARMVVCLQKTEAFMKAIEGFIMLEEHKIMQGGLELHALVLEKSAKPEKGHQ